MTLGFALLAWDARMAAPSHRAAGVIGCGSAFQPLSHPDHIIGMALATQAPTQRVTFGSFSVWIVGELRSRDDGALTALHIPKCWGGVLNAEAVAMLIVERFWGRYLMIAAEAASVQIMVDPSGEVQAHQVEHEGVALIGDHLDRAALARLGKPISPLSAAIAQIVTTPQTAVHSAPLEGVKPLIPGRLAPILCAREGRAIWKPVSIARETASPEPARLRNVVAQACRAAGPHDALMLLSGGLDSSIVLGTAALHQTPLAALNFATGTAEGDEQVYAEEMARRSNTPLVTRMPDAPPDLKRLAEAAQGVQPYIFGLDSAFEDLVDGTANELGATHVITGQGGDAVFFQPATPLVMLDRLRHAGFTAFKPRSLAFEAGRNRTSVWGLLWSAFRARGGGAWSLERRLGAHLLAPAMLEELKRSDALHPWFDKMGDLSAAKRMHLLMIADAQLFMTRRAFGGIGLRHPLLMQPVIEELLRCPVSSLCDGPLDRQLARDVFAPILPDAIVHRRAKGAASHYYSKAVVDQLTFLQEYLLDGALVEAGILDRSGLERALTVEHQFYTNDYSAIIMQVSCEAWLRSWL